MIAYGYLRYFYHNDFKANLSPHPGSLLFYSCFPSYDSNYEQFNMIDQPIQTILKQQERFSQKRRDHSNC